MRRLGSGGVAAVEFALVAPVLALMIMGVAEETALLRAQMKVTHAAGLLGKMVAQQATGVTGGRTGTLANLCTGAGLTMAPLPAIGYAAAIASVTTVLSGTVTVTAEDWESDAACATAATPIGPLAAANAATAAGLVPNAGDSVIIVKASYGYVAATHYILSAKYTLTQTIYVRPRSNTTIMCTSCS